MHLSGWTLNFPLLGSRMMSTCCPSHGQHLRTCVPRSPYRGMSSAVHCAVPGGMIYANSSADKWHVYVHILTVAGRISLRLFTSGVLPMLTSGVANNRECFRCAPSQWWALAIAMSTIVERHHHCALPHHPQYKFTFLSFLTQISSPLASLCASKL